jgi:hypothetical protein
MSSSQRPISTGLADSMRGSQARRPDLLMDHPKFVLAVAPVALALAVLIVWRGTVWEAVVFAGLTAPYVARTQKGGQGRNAA